MIIVTGGAGFIGSNLIHQLNALGKRNILVVDNLAPAPNLSGPKFLNLQAAQYADYMDKLDFLEALLEGDFDDTEIEAIFHQGACSNTLEDDGRYMMHNNYDYSKVLLHYAVDNKIPLIYASTAATYGLSEVFKEVPANEKPLNVYGFSKLVFDNYLRRRIENIDSAVVGLRYFNVYGPREQHKGRMASVIHHFTKQLKDTGTIRMFEGSGGYADGEQRRDFVFVKDLCRINLFFAGLLPDSPKEPVQAIVNAGTGNARTFKAVAEALMAVHGEGKIEYIPFPGDLKNRYQHFTEADVAGLRAAGYTAPFTSLEEGIKQTFAEEPVK
ncbi:ADP-glyceromanno-heptose 6-epimerase precursor [Granulicella pectinivorans]|uniref:ADP-L-glycero-D-manno-heptose-6-epimerase n=1 Tax=Granulicella pectinivorans TaxID=474950 RepID=A0A1I6MJL3_9BACT|nr:ADP-glyceromanno-heptose 6-epimerase [Granulicella pectinivorans]SFS15808.1 ADP-glyceromanno-heptose 6-epimerase precursor [Granulicella pectinivorans]